LAWALTATKLKDEARNTAVNIFIRYTSGMNGSRDTRYPRRLNSN
jgi:hypothetical protein